MRINSSNSITNFHLALASCNSESRRTQPFVTLINMMKSRILYLISITSIDVSFLYLILFNLSLPYSEQASMEDAESSNSCFIIKIKHTMIGETVESESWVVPDIYQIVLLIYDIRFEINIEVLTSNSLLCVRISYFWSLRANWAVFLYQHI